MALRWAAAAAAAGVPVGAGLAQEVRVAAAASPPSAATCRSFHGMATRTGGPAEVLLERPEATVRLARLGVRRPGPVLVVSGTTSLLEPGLAERLFPLVAAAVAVTAEHRAAIVTGGTDAGVLHLVRLAVGVAPDGLVTRARPGPDEARDEGDRVPVAPQLDVLVRVPGSTWGDETPALASIVGRLAGRFPAVVLLIGGGDVSRRELVEHLSAGLSIVVVAGSGRLADAVAGGHDDAGTEQGRAANGTHDDLRPLLATRGVHVVDLDEGPERLRGVLSSLLARPQRRSALDRFAPLAPLPRWRFRPRSPDPPLDQQAARHYPSLREQIAEADRLIYPFFADWDTTAQIEQNRHRWFTVLAIGGGLLTTVFGALQAWLQTVAWPGVVAATLAAATSALTTVARRQGSLHGYLTARVRAERLRSLYFEYIADPPANDEAARLARLRDLEQRVVQIQSAPVTS
jgi:SLOG in TRPM, prokaryote